MINSSMSPPVYYQATFQIAGVRYNSKWIYHNGKFKCIDADKNIASWMKDKDFFAILPRLIQERIYLRFDYS